MKPRDDNPAQFRENVYKSWKIMAQLTRRIDGDCYVVHSDTPVGVGYDSLVLMARTPNGSMVPQVVMNRNGVNSLTVPFIWKRCDEIGIEDVVEELLTACQAGKTTEPVESELSRCCDEVVSWIEEHHDEDFYVGPVRWWGSCRELLDIPEAKYPSDIWPFGRHGPEISLGVNGIELSRLVALSREMSPDDVTEDESQTTKVRRLALKIARCGEIRSACHNPKHECHKIVTSQKELGTDYRQVPEAWAGNLELARILFLSSNPSISTPRVPGTGEDYPLAGYFDPRMKHPRWSAERILDFQVNRLDQARQTPFVNEKAQFLCLDEKYRGSDSENGIRSSQKYWKAAIAQTSDLLGDSFDISTDMCMTEIVHCKSKGELGVSKASAKCSERYLPSIFELTGAELVLVGGARARDRVHENRNGWRSLDFFWDINEQFGFFRQALWRPSDHVGLIVGHGMSRIVIATEQLSYASNKFRFVEKVIGQAATGQLRQYLRSPDEREFTSREDVLRFLAL